MSRLLECIISCILWLITSNSCSPQARRAIIIKKGFRVAGTNQWMLCKWNIIHGCKKKKKGGTVYTMWKHFEQKAHFCSVGQANQNCIAWTTQPNLVCLGSTESESELCRLPSVNAQLLEFNSLCLASCTNSGHCRSKQRMISLSPQQSSTTGGRV